MNYLDNLPDELKTNIYKFRLQKTTGTNLL